LARGLRNIGWHTHPNRVILAQIDKAEIRPRLDFSVTARVDFFLLDRKIADETVASIT
jgi:hypothetical protein